MTTEVSDAEKALAALGIELDKAVAVDIALQQKRSSRDNRICICGHGISRHTDYAGTVVCKPTKMDCPCKTVRPVLEVEDTRYFLRATQGGGMMHALSRGLSALAVAGKRATWLVELKCDRCGSVDEILSPVPVTNEGRSRTYDTGYHGLLCQSCREEV